MTCLVFRRAAAGGLDHEITVTSNAGPRKTAPQRCFSRMAALGRCDHRSRLCDTTGIVSVQVMEVVSRATNKAAVAGSRRIFEAVHSLYTNAIKQKPAKPGRVTVKKSITTVVLYGRHHRWIPTCDWSPMLPSRFGISLRARMPSSRVVGSDIGKNYGVHLGMDVYLRLDTTLPSLRRLPIAAVADFLR